MEVTAQLNNLRMTPRKVRSLTAILKGMDARRAQSQLTYTARRPARPLVKLIDSALANAQNNFGLVKENMYIKQVLVNEGPKLKRFRPKGFGRTSPIEKKTAHIRLVLEERVPGMKAEKKRPEPKTEPTPVAGQEEHQAVEKKPLYPLPEKAVRKASVLGNLKRKFFRRKTI